MLIEIVTHCYAEQLHHYAGCLCYHLSSLFLHRSTQTRVRATVCYVGRDEYTGRVLSLFDGRVDIKRIDMGDPSWLGRRSIGRNQAAKQSEADLVWFCDVDHVIGPGLLDSMAGLVGRWPSNRSMAWPKQVMIHQDHSTGDRAIRMVSDVPRLVTINPKEFVPRMYRRAIGGVQIVLGDFARRWGYVPHVLKYQQPVTKPFGNFRDDIAYREFCQQHGGIQSVELPGVYRIRHSETSYQ